MLANTPEKLMELIIYWIIHFFSKCNANLQISFTRWKWHAYPSSSGCTEAKYCLLYGICTYNMATNVVSSLHYTGKPINFCSPWNAYEKLPKRKEGDKMEVKETTKAHKILHNFSLLALKTFDDFILMRILNNRMRQQYPHKRFYVMGNYWHFLLLLLLMVIIQWNLT